MDISKLKKGDTVLVRCTVEAVFTESQMVMVTTRDCDHGFDAYVDEIVEDEENDQVFPAIVGAPAEMLVNGKWIKGKIVKDYRFDDGIVTIEDSNGNKYWCGSERTELYMEIKGE